MPKSNIINKNFVLTLPKFIGITRVRAKNTLNSYKNVNYRTNPVVIPYECCKDTPLNFQKLKSFRVKKINVYELNIAHNKLDQYSDHLDDIINATVVKKQIS